MLEDKLTRDLKAALLAGDKVLVTTIRGLKSALLYAKIAAGTRDQAMPDDAVIAVLQKEAKKRQESADLYKQGGNAAKAEAELTEKAVIDGYLPRRLSETEIAAVVDAVVAEQDSAGRTPNMGSVIGQVRQRTAGAADGSTIALLVKARLDANT